MVAQIGDQSTDHLITSAALYHWAIQPFWQKPKKILRSFAKHLAREYREMTTTSRISWVGYVYYSKPISNQVYELFCGSRVVPSMLRVSDSELHSNDINKNAQQNCSRSSRRAACCWLHIIAAILIRTLFDLESEKIGSHKARYMYIISKYQ